MKFIFTIFSLFTLLSLSAQNKDERIIRSILSDQTTQWNKGNIEGFMKGYWDNDSLMFIGQNGPKYGFKTTLENYKKNYPDTVAMGKLSFNILKVQQVSTDYYFVLGKWMLQRSIGNLDGYYTLLFRRINKKWVIISDHSS